MKKIILILVLTSSYSNLFAQAEIKLQKVEYYFTSPNEDSRYDHYKITLNSDGSSKIIYTINRDTRPGEALIFEFRTGENDIEKLNQIFKENNIIESSSQYNFDSLANITASYELAKITYSKFFTNDSISAPVKLETITTPSYPQKELKQKLEPFYNFINSLVPIDIKEKIISGGGKYIRK